MKKLFPLLLLIISFSFIDVFALEGTDSVLNVYVPNESLMYNFNQYYFSNRGDITGNNDTLDTTFSSLGISYTTMNYDGTVYTTDNDSFALNNNTYDSYNFYLSDYSKPQAFINAFTTNFKNYDLQYFSSLTASESYQFTLLVHKNSNLSYFNVENNQFSNLGASFSFFDSTGAQYTLNDMENVSFSSYVLNNSDGSAYSDYFLLACNFTLPDDIGYVDENTIAFVYPNIFQFNTSSYFLENGDSLDNSSSFLTSNTFGEQEDFRIERIYFLENGYVEAERPNSSINRHPGLDLISEEDTLILNAIESEFQCSSSNDFICWLERTFEILKKGFIRLGNAFQLIFDSIAQFFDDFFDVNDYSDVLATIQDDQHSAITTIVTLPINLLSHFQNGLNSSCTAFSIGSLLGTPLVFPCLNIESRIGYSLYHTIDSLFCLFMIYNILLLIFRLFEKLTSLTDLTDFFYGFHKKEADVNE